ncbi:lysophospholipid acyltransferase family protein [bacterium]|nr:lysophospholipid acyltransferase family protein [bacterium]
MAQSRSVGRRIEAAAVLSTAAIVRRLPLRARIGFGEAVGSLLHAVDRRHRELARTNIALSLGVGADEAARIARRTFRCLGRGFAETLTMSYYRGAALERAVEVEGVEHLRAAYALGKGVVVCSGHIGNWELAGLRQCQLGVPMDYISRPLDNPWLYDRLLQWREAGGVFTHAKHGAVRSALKTLKAGRTLAFVIDQNMTSPPRIFVPFFGRAAATTPTMAHLSLRTGAPIVPAYTIPRDDGTYLLRYLPAIAVPETGDEDAKVRAITLEATRLLEEWIRACPHSWLWLHDRWKTRPGPGEEI